MTHFPPIDSWRIPEAALTQSLSEMARDGAFGTEGIVLWLGRRHHGTAEVTHLVAPRGPGMEKRPDLLVIKPALMSEVTDVAVELGVVLVGQIHSHGPWHGVDLSITDRRYGVAVPHHLSIVAPNYAMTPGTRIEDCGVHVFEPGYGYRRLGAPEVASRLQVVPGSQLPLVVVGEHHT